MNMTDIHGQDTGQQQILHLCMASHDKYGHFSMVPVTRTDRLLIQYTDIAS